LNVEIYLSPNIIGKKSYSEIVKGRIGGRPESEVRRRVGVVNGIHGRR